MSKTGLALARFLCCAASLEWIFARAAHAGRTDDAAEEVMAAL